MPRPCDHVEIDPACRVCELWAEYPEYYSLWEGLPAPRPPATILELRKTVPTLWRSPGLVRQMAEASRPGLFQKVVNFARAATAHAATGFAPAGEATRDARRALCLACPERLPDDSCRRCGCNLTAKIAWASSACPLGGW